MPIKHPFLYLSPVIIMLILGCNRNYKSHDLDQIENRTGQEIYLHARQIVRAGITYGSITTQTEVRYIACSGKLVIPPEHIYCIASQASGMVTKLFYSQGSPITTGSVLAILEDSDFIILQQNYLEALNQYEFSREEYARQGELTVDNATSMKRMQLARRDFQSAEINVNAFRAQLEILGLHADSIQSQRLIPRIFITAPRSGKLSRLHIHTGSYVQKGDPLFELQDSHVLLAEFHVPPQFMSRLNQAQIIDCHPSFDSLSHFKAIISRITYEAGNENPVGLVHALVADDNRQLTAGMHIQGSFFVGTDTLRMVMENAIIQSGVKYFVFVKNKGRFQRFEIHPGIVKENQVEIIGLPAEIADSVVLSGLGYLNSRFKTQ